MSLYTLHDLFIGQLRELYSAEKQILLVLPKLARTAANDALRRAFFEHLRETREQVTRLDAVFAVLGIPADGGVCRGTERLLETCEETMADDGATEVLDAALIVHVQSIVHCQMAAYGATRAIASSLDHPRIVSLLSRSMQEEVAADRRLTDVAEREVNAKALTADNEVALYV